MFLCANSSQDEDHAAEERLHNLVSREYCPLEHTSENEVT